MGRECSWEEHQQSRGECGEAEGFSGVAEPVLALLSLCWLLCVWFPGLWALLGLGHVLLSVSAPEVGTATSVDL